MFSVSMWIFGKYIYGNVYYSMFQIAFVQIPELDWLSRRQKGYIFKKMLKNLFSETISWMKLILYFEFLFMTSAST